MSISGEIGFQLNLDKSNLNYSFLFGEDQGRYIISVEDKNLNDAIEYIKKSNISYLNIGKTNGKKIKIDRDNEIDIEELRDLYENWFKSYLKSN